MVNDDDDVSLWWLLLWWLLLWWLLLWLELSIVAAELELWVGLYDKGEV